MKTTGDESDWTNLELNFDSDASPILIEITVENLSTDRELQVSLENDIQASGLNISITKDSQPYTAGNTAMLAKSTGDGTSTTTFVMSLTVANPDENLTDANFNYILNIPAIFFYEFALTLPNFDINKINKVFSRIQNSFKNLNGI